MVNVERPAPPHPIRCPTCGASQSRSAECRRCKCDLSLVVTALLQIDGLASSCCRLLQQGRFAEAERVARQLAELAPSEDANRYLGVCWLLLGRYESALRLLRDSLRPR